MSYPQSGAACNSCSTALALHAILIAAVLAVAGCASFSTGSENETEVRIVDLKISGEGPFGWVDNEAFVVAMETGERYVRKDGVEVPVKRVATINYRSGERKFFGQVNSRVCFSDGYVSYFFQNEATGDLWVSYGELGKEITERTKPGERNFDNVDTCRPLSEVPKPPKWAEGRHIWHLRREHGYINCSTSDIYGPDRWSKARFHSPDDEVGVELPFACYSVRLRLKYYPFKDAYFSAHHAPVIPWPIGEDRKAYWLLPDGKVETIVLPYSSVIRGGMVPTVRGIVAFSRPATRQEVRGVYLITSAGKRLISHGYAVGVTSPDGCRVAILHEPGFEARLAGGRSATGRTFKVLEVCN